MRGRAGFTLIEVLAAVAFAALLAAAVGSVVSTALQSDAASRTRRERTRVARFALERVEYAVRHASVLVLPLVDNPGTAQDESTRDVVAVDLDPTRDLDVDGVPDADNDGDGAIDEDPGADMNFDEMPGIAGIDDDLDGQVDESNKEDDDEDEDDAGGKDEDVLDRDDNDGDGSIDEDSPGDWNGDGESGLSGVDDDGDGQVDESNQEDDDEDEDDGGDTNEDWIDTVVFYLQGTTLIERTPVPWDVDANATQDGRDYVESPLAENVSEFTVVRVPRVAGSDQLVDLTLELSDGPGETVRLETQVRLGADR